MRSRDCKLASKWLPQKFKPSGSQTVQSGERLQKQRLRRTIRFRPRTGRQRRLARKYEMPLRLVGRQPYLPIRGGLQERGAFGQR
jgi:hypothetical protein